MELIGVLNRNVLFVGNLNIMSKNATLLCIILIKIQFLKGIIHIFSQELRILRDAEIPITKFIKNKNKIQKK